MGQFSGKRIGVIMGGPSSERAVSLNSGAGVLRALVAKGYDAVAIDLKSLDDDLGAQLREQKIAAAWLALHSARKGRGVVLLEEYVKGREINVGVLDDEALGEVEIRPATEFYDYEAKYLRDDTQYLCPAPISDGERHMLHDLAVRAHKAL